MAKIDLPQSTDTAIDNFSGRGAQFLSIERLQEFQKLKYGMFIHYGMSTFDGKELSAQEPLETYNPTALDVDQWIRVAKNAGMQYAVLTTKHVAGHALWCSKHGEYSVKYSKDTTDVVAEFVKACRKYGLKPCFYYCAWDNTNLFGMNVTPNWSSYAKGYTHTNDAYRDFMWKQIEELLTNYGEIEMLWVDIPFVLPQDKKFELYKFVKKISPNIIFAYNHSCQNGSELNSVDVWPTDIMTMERTIPNHASGHAKKSYYNWKAIRGEQYYIPGEYNDTIGKEWFFEDSDEPRNDHDLLAMVLGSTSRGVNCLLNVPPSKEGIIPQKWIDPLMKLKANLKKVDFFKEHGLNVD